MTNELNQQLIKNAGKAFEGVAEGHHLVAIEYDPATKQIAFITNTDPDATKALVEQAYVKMHSPKDADGVLEA